MDIIAPTKERLAKHSDWETPQSDQKTRRSHYRTMNPVEGMHRRGWIRDEQWQAFQKWSADLTKATRVHVAMVKYGRPFVTVDEHSLDPADAAACAVGRVRAAASDVGHANTIRALTVAALRESSLETIEIGRAHV